MDITYFKVTDKRCAIEICIFGDTWDISYDGYNGEFLCSVLNRDYFDILPFSEKEYTKSCKLQQQISALDKVLEISIEAPKYAPVGEATLNWLKESIEELDVERCKGVANLVLLNKDEFSSAKQRFLAYRSVYKDYKFGSYTSKTTVSMDFGGANTTDEDEITHYENMEKLLKGQSHDTGLKLAKKYINQNNIKAHLAFKYEFESFKDLFNFMFITMIDSDDTIRTCQNCSKYFYPHSRSDAIYCDRISPQDENKTCKEYGAIKTYQDNLKTNKAMGLYRKIYMQKQMLAKRNPDIVEYSEDFEKYKIQSKQWKKEVKDGIKTEVEYLAWLKSARRKREDDE